METKKTSPEEFKPIKQDAFENLWGESWTYINTMVDVSEEPILILNKEYKVVVANEPFYQTFQVMPEDTENKTVFALGNHQWDITALRNLLEDIIKNNSFFKGFEVAQEFPFIGRKVMVLNARQIFFKDNSEKELCPPIILLAIDDVTEMMNVAKAFAGNANKLESQFNERSLALGNPIKVLETKNNTLLRKEMNKDMKKNTLNS